MVDLARYRRDGYLVLPSVVPPALLAPLLGRIDQEVDRLSRSALAAGTIPRTYAELPVERRLLAVSAAAPPPPRHFDDLLFGPEICAILGYPGLTDVLAAILGPNVTYQGNGHLRAHLPGRLDPLPWHQDAQFYGAGVEGMAEHMAQVWIPLVDAPAERGCLAVVPGSHRWGLQPEAVAGAANVVQSSADRQRLIYRTNAERVAGEPVRVLPMRRGDLLVFNSLLVHTATENSSDAVRWSVDLRFEATYETTALDDRARDGYRVMHRRLRGRGYVPLAVRDPRGAAEDWEAWQRRKDEVAAGRWRP
jgi:phytanoyl-CoA hydroxylase